MRKSKNTEGRHAARVGLLLAALLFALPVFTVTVVRGQRASEQPEEPIHLLPPGEIDSARTLRVLDGDTVTEMSFSDYLQGVLRAEMPASFQEDALRAQAVAARTYTYYKMSSGGNHGDTADICTDHSCCQAFLGKEKAADNWGKNAERYEAKIENAVSATDGQVMLYGGAPILAVFHSSSAGETWNSGEVWAQDLPYLQSVSSPEGEGVPNYYSTVELTEAEFREKFLAARPEADLSGPASGWIRDPVMDGVHVESVTIGGVSVSGPSVRSIFGLRSASFTAEAGDGKITFYVTGYGHGVGLSQYGANAMAEAGSTWREILEHYYTGVTIGTWTGA
ncbi:MAG: stage II sporulation protein D [Dysosmobacter sp.]|nr:stage II sporulation protein D [Dysosmobacter sp.]